MSDIQKGEYVNAIDSGTGSRVRGYGAVAFKAGEELLVTSISQGHLNVRKGDGYVFRVHRNKVKPATRLIGQVPEGGIGPDDPRVAWIFEDAGRLADRLGLCKDYDRLCDALGAPGRVRTYTIQLAVADGINITAKVDARSRPLAERMVREQFAGIQTSPLALAAGDRR